MVAKQNRKPTGTARAIRASATLPAETYATLRGIARQKKVSFAWVMRDAAEKYIAEQWPLLEKASK